MRSTRLMISCDNMNLYAYVNNDPVNARDPSGTTEDSVLPRIQFIDVVGQRRHFESQVAFGQASLLLSLGARLSNIPTGGSRTIREKECGSEPKEGCVEKITVVGRRKQRPFAWPQQKSSHAWELSGRIIQGSIDTEEEAKEIAKAVGKGLPAECEAEWEEALVICVRELAKRNPSRGITGGYKDPYRCAKGLVSERCGGNAVSASDWRKRRGR